MRTLSLSSAVRDAAACEFLDGLSPVGQNPLDKTIVTKAWAGVFISLLSSEAKLSIHALFSHRP